MNDNINSVFKALEREQYLKVKEDNILLLQYLKSKEIGTYESLDYGIDSNGCCNKTLLKDAILIKQALRAINKPFRTLTREDALSFKNKLKTSELKARKWKKDAATKKHIIYDVEMSFRTKKNLLGALKQFWHWYQEYQYHEEHKEIGNIFERIKLRSPKITEYRIDWLNSDQLKKLLHILEPHDDFRLFVTINIDTAARPIEIANLQRKHFIYDENGVLHCQLPSIKGCSGRKHLNEVLFERAYIEEKVKDLNPDDFLFDYIDKKKPFPESSGCFDWKQKGYNSLKARTKHFTRRITGKGYSPYVYRKTATMYWLKVSNNNVLWVQKRLGHIEGSNQIKHYMTLQGVQAPEGIAQKIKDDKYQSASETMLAYQEELQSNKLQVQQMQQQMKVMQQQFLNMVANIPKINAVNHREIINQTIAAVKSQDSKQSNGG